MRKNKKVKMILPTPIQSTYLPDIQDFKYFSDFIEFARWSVTSRQDRQPKTREEFAALIGRHEYALSNWEKHPQFELLTLSFLAELLDNAKQKK